MTEVICTWCPRHCVLGTLTLTVPKDVKTKVPGKTPEGIVTTDIRPYCRTNYIP